MILLIFCVCSINISFSQVVFSNTITGINPAQFNPFINNQYVDPNLSVSGIGRGQGITPIIGDNIFNAANFTGSIRDTSDYFSFILSPVAGQQLNLISFNYTGIRNGAGPLNFALRSSINNFASDIGTGNAVSSTISLSAVSFQNLAGAVEFRLYGWNAVNASGTFGITSFSFQGMVAVSPRLTAGTLSPFGSVCVGNTSATQTLQLSGAALTMDSVQVGPLKGYQLSVDGSVYYDSVRLYMPGSQTQNVFVRFVPDTISPYNGNILAFGGGASAINIMVSGNGLGTRPSITNGTAGSITTSSAVVSFSVVSVGCSTILGIGLEYSSSPGFLNGTGFNVPLSTFSQNVSGYNITLSSLGPPGTIYYYHTYITNNSGVKYGLENSFILLSDVTSLTIPISGAGSLSAFGNTCIQTTSAASSFTITGSVLDNSNIIVGPLSGFVFSTSATGTYTNTLNIVSGGAPYNYNNSTLTNCRIYVKFMPLTVGSYNGNINVSGGGATTVVLPVIATGVNTPPDVVTGNAVQIAPYSATIQGSIRGSGCSTISSYGFEYSTNPGFIPGTGTMVNASNLSGNNFNLVLNGLQPSTLYYYYAYAVNTGGIDYGGINSFFTSAVPTQLVVTAIIPSLSTAFTPFMVKVTAVDNLNNLNPINVTSDTYIQLVQTAGVNLFNPAANPAGLIVMGTNSVVLPGCFVDGAENGIAIKAVSSSGMNLTDSPPFIFDVLPYDGGGEFIWSANNERNWLDGNHWQTGTSPGSTLLNDNNHHIAKFTSLASLDAVVNSGAGIDMAQVNGDLSLGAIIFDSSYTGSAADGYLKIGNSSTVRDGVLQLNGSLLNGQPALDGLNAINVMLSNRLTSGGIRDIAIVHAVNGGDQSMQLNFASEGYLIADSGSSVALNIPLSGTNNLHFSGGGSFHLNPQGTLQQNSFSGDYLIEFGRMVTHLPGSFSNVTPNNIMLGDNYGHNGSLDIFGQSLMVGGIGSVFGDTNNIITTGVGNATLHIRSEVASDFYGIIKDGAAGSMVSVIKSGSGTQHLYGNNSYTGATTVLDGTLVLANVNGNTIMPSSNVTISGNGILKIMSSQTIHDLNLYGGTLWINNGAVLTITGNYTQTSVCRLYNYGKIILQGTSRQYFPGITTLIQQMNDVTINNPAGVTLNRSLRINGILHLNEGNMNWGGDTLSICHEITGNTGYLQPAISSWFEIFGNDNNAFLPGSVHQLAGMLVSTSATITMQGNLTLQQQLYFADSSGTLSVPYDVTLNGPASLYMNGGKLKLNKCGVLLPEFTGSYQLSGGEVIFNGVCIASDAQRVRPINYHDLSFASNGGERILSNVGVTGIIGAFQPGNAFVQYDGSTIDFKKSGWQEIPSFNYYNLKITGANNSTKVLSGEVKIHAQLTIGALTKLDLDNYDCILVSDSLLTAQVDAVPTANSFLYSGNGRFIVERYLPSGVRHGKSWQFLSVPVSGAKLKESWQMNASPLEANNPGYGITVSSGITGAVQRGYDFFTANGGSSVKSYIPLSNTWAGVDDGITPTENVNISNRNGYMVFVRGDRSVQQFNSTATPTTLRHRGKLYSKGVDAPVNMVMNAGQFTSIGNPYASGIDFTTLQNQSTGMDPVFYVWDPLLPGAYGLGGYQTLSSINGFHPIPGGTLNYDNNNVYTKIASGQAFMAYSTSGGIVQFTESVKSNIQFSPYRATANKFHYRIELLNNEDELIDGSLLLISNDFVSDIDMKDAKKLTSGAADCYIIKASEKCAMATMPIPRSIDSVMIGLNLFKNGTYKIRIITDAAGSRLPTSYFNDHISGDTLSINSDTIIHTFNLSNEQVGQVQNRFSLIFHSPIRNNYTQLNSKGNIPSGLFKNNNLEVAYQSDKLLKIKNSIGFGSINQFNLYDNNGKKIQSGNLGTAVDAETNYLKINAILPSGIYFLEVFSRDKNPSSCVKSVQLIL